MDNSYYTGATLIRATGGGCGGGNKYHHNHQPQNYYHHKHYHHQASTTSLAGSPLLMQSNILTGLPLIRNGQHIPPVPAVPPPPSLSPPGLICCFQPIYYFPNNNNTTSTSPTNFQTPNMLPFCNNNRGHKQNVRGNHIQGHNNKRKHYNKTQQKQKPNFNSFVVAENQNLVNNNGYHHGKKSIPAINLNNNVSSSDENENESDTCFKYKILPDPISPPPRQNNSGSTSVDLSSHCSQLLQEQQYFFTSSIESTKELSTSSEEKQRNDKLLNFYFYDEHWRPKDDSEQNCNSREAYSDNNNSIIDTSHCQNYSSSWDHETGSNFSKSNSPTEEIAPSSSSTIKQQKDLEVEAQIITLANGHRDLEIRLCYVTS